MNQKIIPGVLYRQGFQDSDYDEAIQALVDAKEQPKFMSMGCSVCTDSCHTSDSCHHNPLVMARRAIGAARSWRCFHCDAVFVDASLAQNHFGAKDGELPACKSV